MDDGELIAAYVGVLRHELELPRGSDALLELEMRLLPQDVRQRPPARAPGIARLAKALKRLRAGKRPAASMDEFADDLRFLRVFDDTTRGWSAEAIDDLLANVISAPEPRARKTAVEKPPADASSPVVQFRQRKPRGDA
jgi:hypothetical protein